MKKTVSIIIFFLLSSCRKDVKLTLPDYQEKVVIEAAIEAGGTALVYLSYSVPYFGDFDYTTPEKAFIKGAVVTISDGTTKETLTELDPSYGYVYAGFNLKGQIGKTYRITVQVNGETYTTSSTILKPVKLDSLYFVEVRGDTLGFIGQKLSEPAGSGDCYRWFAKRLGRDQFYAAPFNSAFDDKFVDGRTFDFSYDRGRQPNSFTQSENDPERGYFKAEDTIVVKFCKIGRKEYDFWFTYYQNKLSNGNPFSAPANVKSMFDNYEKCFGSFVAYSPVFDTIIIPKEKK
ncbi:hypothetical protein CNR22_19270 [Sphingobacteriaceae bacterium]|nr:hypothetical protein CNR22_19270 [Sphingobacteriaceae bacterium]